MIWVAILQTDSQVLTSVDPAVGLVSCNKANNQLLQQNLKKTKEATLFIWGQSWAAHTSKMLFELCGY